MGRLFWKIFFWFWSALILLSLGIGLSIKFYYEQVYAKNEQVIQQQIAQITDAFHSGNYALAQQLMKDTQRTETCSVYALDELGRDYFGETLPQPVYEALRRGEGYQGAIRKSVDLPNDHKVTLVGLYSTQSTSRITARIGLAIALLISTLVCYLLARYLSLPIHTLSRATRQITEGNLSVRIGALGRRDEIGDLASDFDLMADKVQYLIASQKRLFQDISHELRSPLARLQVALALAQRHRGEKELDYTRMSKDLNRLEQLIDEVLTLSRLDIITYPRESVALDDLIHEIVADCDLEAAQKNCHIRLRNDALITLQASPELLRRAIENVLRNAIKHTADATDVLIESATDDNEITLHISDTGSGVPENSKDDIFEAFVRLDASRPHKPGGYGLGLAIARKAVELHGGHIKANNRYEGGLTVSITLPLTQQ